MGVEDSRPTSTYKSQVPLVQSRTREVCWEDIASIVNSDAYRVCRTQSQSFLNRRVFWLATVIDNGINELELQMDPRVDPQIGGSFRVYLAIPAYIDQAMLKSLIGHQIYFIADIAVCEQQMLAMNFINADIYRTSVVLNSACYKEIARRLRDNNPLPLRDAIQAIRKSISWAEFLLQADPFRYQTIFDYLGKFIIRFKLEVVDKQLLTVDDHQHVQLAQEPKEKLKSKQLYIMMGVLKDYLRLPDEKLLFTVQPLSFEQVKEFQSTPSSLKARLTMNLNQVQNDQIIRELGQIQINQLNRLMEEQYMAMTGHRFEEY